MVDTGKGSKNTFDDFQAKTINENHNSRQAVMTAYLFAGYGAETKYSTSMRDVETYAAKRAGDRFEGGGACRVSRVV